ncbi:MAG: hypothetical protein AMJ91_01980 [candidate division Zixibacteria bacterium SM23_73_3]|nr:MAG: hypothetical protein AMJ91_01980 [candidate division Zixibacteria bacterium SM23_73_3]
MKKPTYVLLGSLLLFVIIYFILVQKEKKTFSPGKVENFLQLDSASVNRIEFKKYDTRLVFQKINQQWHMIEPDSYRADKGALGQLLSMTSRLEVGELISSNQEKQFLFQVDTLMGTGINFVAGEKLLASLVIGKLSDDYLHVYLRKTDSDDVYLAPEILNRIANRKITQWRNRAIFIFDPAQVNEIELNQGKDKFKLTRQDTLWQLSQYPYRESSVADGEAVEDYVKTLKEMRADNFARTPEIEDVDFQKFDLLLKFTFLDGHQERLFATRRDEEDNRYLVKTDQDKSVFILFEHNFKRLAKKFKDFLPKEET